MTYQRAVDGVLENFPLAQADMFGFCNNYKAPEFLVDQEPQFCNQPITDVQQAAQTFLNAQTYATGLFDNIGTATFTQGTLYLKGSGGGTSGLQVQETVPATAASGCDIQNAVREVFFTVFYQADSSGLYTIKKVVYDMVVQ